MKYENQILDAIETIVNSAVTKAGYDRTIQATIIKCEDPTIGKYKVQYQDSTFYAYSGSSEIAYVEGSDVYILVPGNDMSRDKTILGTTARLGKNYATAPEGEEAFEVIGSNCIESNNKYELCSYKTVTEYEIYNRNKTNNDLRLNLKSIDAYIHSATSIILAATIKTSLPTEQQFRGRYGIVYEMAFKDNASEEEVIRNYVLDVNQFEGNPYKMPNYKRQVGIFDIDGVNFQYVNRIYLFCYDFPNQDNNKPNDIFIKELEMCAGQPLSAADLEASSLSFITSQGVYFDNNDSDKATRLIQAQVRVKGKYIDPKTQKLPYYWFIENNSITSLSEDFCSYGGQGWKCLNTKNIVKPASDGVAPVVEWVPADYQFTVEKAMSEARETKYKCAVLFNNILLTREFTITNYSSNYEITIESDGGTQFYYDIGNPSLTCNVKGGNANDNYTYQWAEVDNNNNFYSLAETEYDNNRYNNAVAAYNSLLAKVKAEQSMPAASQDELDGYLTIIKEYDKIMRIEGNKVHHLQVNEITNFTTFKCSVYKNGIYIGTASIVINNDLDKQDVYSLVINQGSQTFKYDEAGVSPANKSLITPQTILPLSFTVYDNLGQQLEEDVIKHCKIKWIVPIENTLLTIPNFYDGQGKVSENGSEKIFEDILEFNYEIKDKYDVAKTHNNIQLIVDYKGMNLASKTDFTFVKEGEPGTNGTEFVCKIVPNTNDKDFGYPMVINGKINYTPKQTNKWFNVEFWHSGDKILTAYATSNTSENKQAKISWSILRNKYTSSLYDITSLSVNNSGDFSYSGYQGTNSPANIIKATVEYDGVEYYATLPIITATAESGYDVSLIENTGFRFATYSADGRTPQYDNSNPFELKVTKVINGITEDISNFTQINAVNYDWYTRGRIYNPVTSQWIDSLHLANYNRNIALTRNQASYKPIDDYDGECVTNGLECIVLNNSAQEVARIHIPIHLLLNKYGQAALNGWDGNSVALDESGGVLLAPQVAAGQKETDNTFTGMLVGKVKEAGRSDYDTGLFGYSHGVRTAFINSKNGSAIFGKRRSENTPGGQIIIDPSSNKAMLYSSEFWINYYTSGDDVDLPRNYNSSNEAGKGMLIDLSTPCIRWGNGNFSVDENGHLIAKGGGEIAGWQIGDNKLYSKAAESGHPKITIDSSIPAIYSNDKTGIANTRDGFYIGSDGFALGKYNSARNHNPFQVTSAGELYSDSGTIGGWTITNDELKSTNEKTHIQATGAMSGPNWSIDANGNATFSNVKITSGNYATSRGNLIDYGTRFYIESNGTLHASNGQFTGAINSGSTISGSAITGGSISIGAYLSVSSDGAMQISNDDGGFLTMKVTAHPYLSGLNLAKREGVIAFRTGTGQTNAGSSVATIGITEDNYFKIAPGSRFYIDSHYGQTFQLHIGAYYVAFYKGIVSGISSNAFSTSTYQLYECV